MADFFITLPTKVDGPHRTLPSFVTDLRPGAFGPYDQLTEIGRAAEIAAWGGALAPFDPDGEESLVVAGGLLRQNHWLRVVAEFHPVIATPVYAAKVSASLQRFSRDRLGWRLALDLDEATAHAQGDFLDRADRYARADEFLTVAKGVWHNPGYTFEGHFYEVLNGGFQAPLSGGTFPRVYLSGTSQEALELSARHADVHVFSPGDDLTILDGTSVSKGLTLPVLAREDDDEAGSAPLGLTGSYEKVAAGIRDYIYQGVTTFFLEATPHVEETYRLGEHLLPLLTKEVEYVR